MRNLRVFENLDEFTAIQQQLSGTGRFVLDIVPGYSYIRQEYLEGREGSRYNLLPGQSDTPFDTRFGNVVYLDPATNTLNTVWWEDYTEDMGEKVGLLVISQEDAPDGNARMIAFTDIFEEQASPKAPLYDNEMTKIDSMWADKNGNGVTNWDYSFNDAQSVCNKTQYPLEDDFSGYTWTYKYNPKRREAHPEFAAPLNSINPVEDKDYYFPHEAAAEFYTEGSQKGDWYVPAAGEMIAGIMDHFEDIRHIMSELCINAKNEFPMWIKPDGTVEYGNYSFGYPVNPGYWTSSLMDDYKYDFNGSTTEPDSGVCHNISLDYAYIPVLTGEFNKETQQYVLGLETAGWYNYETYYTAYVRPMAMFKDGEIVRTTGEATANGHLVSDWFDQGHNINNDMA